MTNGPDIRQIAATVHGRFLLRPASGDSKGIFVGFHGYGENAERLLEALLEIPGAAQWSLAAIQGLHPFYNTKTGEVVASWMTKLDREDAIVDNIAYVAEAVRTIRSKWGDSQPLVYVGFSQGTAMAYRAAAGAGHPCHGLIALAGDVPPELAERSLEGFPEVLIGRGEGDEWYTAEKLIADVALLTSKGIEVETSVFEGGHEWTGEFRHRCAAFLTRLTDR